MSADKITVHILILGCLVVCGVLIAGSLSSTSPALFIGASIGMVAGLIVIYARTGISKE